MTKLEGNPKTEARSMALYHRAKELTEFCLRRSPRLWEGWTVPNLFRYCFFHLATRTAFVLKDNPMLGLPQITAVMFIWGMPEEEIRARADAGEATFDWKVSRDKADALFLGEVISAGSDRDSNAKLLAKLFRQASSRWPDWEQKKLFTYRNGFLVQIRPEVIRKLVMPNGAPKAFGALPGGKENHGR